MSTKLVNGKRVELSQAEIEARTPTLDDLKLQKLAEMKAHYQSIRQNPNCDTGLGFRVDADYENLTDFKTGSKRGLLQVKDYHNQFHTVNPADLTTIVTAIEDFGIAVKARKWALEIEISTATEETIQAIDVLTGWPQ